MLACTNLGKNAIQQSLQQKLVPLDGTKDVLTGACKALAEDILNNVQLKLWENGSVTQKEVLSHACRSLAMLIKTQCPRGAGEVVQLYGDIEYVLSESLLAVKLADVMNTRELVECVCTRHDEGLKTVLLTACQWLLNDIKALFLFEEVWNNLFIDEHLIHAEFYTQLRPLLNAMVFQIKCGARLETRDFQKTNFTDDVTKNHYNFKSTSNTGSKSQYETKSRCRRQPIVSAMEIQRQPNYGHSAVPYYSDINGTQHISRSTAEKCINTNRYFHYQQDLSIIINNRETCVSYILELINARDRQRCYATTLKLWRLLTQADVFPRHELFEERVCYLITFRTYPFNSAQCLSAGSFGDLAFKEDVKIKEIGHPIWPKDISVVKRWFPHLTDQAVVEAKDSGNQCLQIWRISSKKVEKRRPKPIKGHSTFGSEDDTIKSFMETPETQLHKSPKRTVGCFTFSKAKQTIDDDDEDY